MDKGHRSLEAELEREAEQLREEKLCLLQEAETVRHQLGEERRAKNDLQQRMDREVRGGAGGWGRRWAGGRGRRR